jgi:hypothetical protein
MRPLLILSLFIACVAHAADPEPKPEARRAPARIDFDDRLIQGQTNKSGSVYLYDRKELKTPSLIKGRKSFRDQIDGVSRGR